MLRIGAFIKALDNLALLHAPCARHASPSPPLRARLPLLAAQRRRDIGAVPARDPGDWWRISICE